MCDTFETNEQPILNPLQDLLALVCMLLRKSDISRKVLAFFVNIERNFCRKLSFLFGGNKSISN